MNKIYKGDVEITTSNQEEWNKKLLGVEEITGYLYIYSQAKLGSLKTVGRDLYINSQAKLEAGSLKTVGGYLYINSQAKLGSLKTVGRYLYIYSQTKLGSLKTVGGDLYINSQAKLGSLKTVGGNLSINSQAKLGSLKTVGGYLYINSQAKLGSLKTVGRDLYINSKIEPRLARWLLLRYAEKKKWYLSDEANISLLTAKLKNAIYRIDNVDFSYDLFNKVRKDKLTAEEVFKIENLEQRRIAYTRMDKIKMKALDSYKVLDICRDDKDKKMEILEFKVDGYQKPFRYLHCADASTDREYHVETAAFKCWEAKNKSFGLKDAEWIEEW